METDLDRVSDREQIVFAIVLRKPAFVEGASGVVFGERSE